MALLNQKTLTKPISFDGIGLHSGKSVKLTVNPSEPDTGIVFKRIDLKNNNLKQYSLNKEVFTIINSSKIR